MILTMRLTPAQEAALTKLLALRKITHDTSTVTRRSQNIVLQSLPNEDLIAVAEQLARHEKEFGW